MPGITKSEIARRYGVTPNTVGIWVRSGLLPAPLKLGTHQQSRVRWTPEDVETLERNLRNLRGRSAA